MPPYQLRQATLGDIDALVDHRFGMFADMGQDVHPGAATAFRSWLAGMMPAGIYHAWVVETGSELPASDVSGRPAEGQPGRPRSIVAGGGLTVLPWPPGPQSLTGRIAFVYNMYTAPAHRRRGIGRLVMEAMHTWCRQNGIDHVRLNASQAGQPMYDSIGYFEAASPMLMILLDTSSSPGEAR